MHVAIKKKKINSELINKDRKRSCGEVPLVSKTSILHLQVQLEIFRPCSCFYFPQQIITESKPISCIASAFISHSIKFFFWHRNCEHYSILSDYNNNTDLHIAVTTSQGIIVEFDRHGLQRHTPKSSEVSWEQSLVVKSVPEAWWDIWDEVLSKVRLYYSEV